jgi:hypothetical protein
VLSWGMRLRAWWVAVLAGCVPVQQPAQSAPAAAPAQGQVTCAMVIDCYTRCSDEGCITACEAGVDPAVVGQSRAFAMCSYQNQCTDTTCQQTRCANEMAACYATGTEVAANESPAAATTPAPIGPTTPTATTPPAAGARTQLLMGLRMTGVGSSYRGGIAWYVLFDDGRVLARLPSPGLEGIDENAFASELGTYKIVGDTMDMWFQQYHPVFEHRSDGSWSAREGTFWPAESLDGAVLDGAYAPRSGPPEIAFTTDGRFESNGGLMIDGGVNGLTPTPAGRGTYRIARNTLTLSFATGQVVRISISTLQAKELPRASSLYLGGFEYHRP